jgi:alginate lyase
VHRSMRTKCDIDKVPMKGEFTRVLIIVVLGLIGVLPNTSSARGAQSQHSETLPRLFSLPGAALADLRHEIAAGKMKDPALEQLRRDADAALLQRPMSVMEKSVYPPSSDKHDYMSQAPYWWPDPSKPNGLPYIRRDGLVNPEIEKIQDHKNFSKLISTTYTLALAYYLFGDESCASHASELLRVWFLKSHTRMNPNLEFAQGIPGRNTGRGIGLIETRELYRLVDAIGLLHNSKFWGAGDQKGMEEWCGKFLEWMIHSQNGKDEAAAKNNHGTYYDVQVASLALFTGETEIARSVLQSAGQKRIATQIEPNGRQPLELARTKALSYSTMNLAGLFELALLGENAEVDLWSYHAQGGGNIRKALDYLLPFVDSDKKWLYEQIVEYKVGEISPLLVMAAAKFKDSHYQALAVKLDPEVLHRIDVLPFRWAHSK